jgi:hypothetical protein
LLRRRSLAQGRAGRIEQPARVSLLALGGRADDAELVLRPIGHHDDQLVGLDLDRMLSPIQWAALEHASICITTGASHMSDDAIARRVEFSPTRTNCRIPGGVLRRARFTSLVANLLEERHYCFLKPVLGIEVPASDRKRCHIKTYFVCTDFGTPLKGIIHECTSVTSPAVSLDEKESVNVGHAGKPSVGERSVADPDRVVTGVDRHDHVVLRTSKRFGETRTSKAVWIYRPSEWATLSECDVMLNELHKEFN